MDERFEISVLADRLHSSTSSRPTSSAMISQDEGLYPARGPFGTAGIVAPDGGFTFNISELPAESVDVRLSDILEEDADPTYHLRPVDAGNMLRRLAKAGLANKDSHALVVKLLTSHAGDGFELEPLACPSCGSTWFRDTADVRHCSPCKTVIRSLI